MNKIKFNPNNAKYYSEDFIKGFECGVERQFNADKEQKMGRWIYTGDYTTDGMLKCSECGFEHDVSERFSYCPNCGADMRKEK